MPFSPNAIQAIGNDCLVTCVQGEFMGKPFNIYGHKGELIFRITDIGEMLGYHKKSFAKTLAWIPASEKLRCPTDISGQRRWVWMVSERGMDIMLTKSNKPPAKQFQAKLLDIKKAWASEGGQISADGTVLTALMRVTAEVAKLGQQLEVVRQENRLQLAGAVQQVQVAEAKTQEALKVADDLEQGVRKMMPAYQLFEDGKGDPEIPLYAPSNISSVYGIGPKTLNKLLAKWKMQQTVEGEWLAIGEWRDPSYSRRKLVQYGRDGKRILHANGVENPQWALRWTSRAMVEIDKRLREMQITPVAGQALTPEKL